MGQSLSMLSDTGIEAREYLFIKLCHGCLAGILTYYLGLAAEGFGMMDLTVGMIYGSDVPWIRQLGKIHQRVYTAGSMIVVLILMAILVALDHFIYGSYHKVHTYIIERRKNDQ